jgi:hypothetical protein
VVYDLDKVPDHGQHQQTPVAVFALEFGRDVVPRRMELHFRLNVHSYSPEVAVPFFGASTEQLLALQMAGFLRPQQENPSRRGIVFRQILLIPITKLLSHVPAADDRQPRHVQWDDWGATGTCRLPAPPMMNRISLSGSRFIPRLGLQDVIRVWDFSRTRVAQLQLRDPESNPYIPKEVALPTGITGGVDVAISEDVIVICEASLFLALRFSQFTLITASFFLVLPLRGESASSRFLKSSPTGAR